MAILAANNEVQNQYLKRFIRFFETRPAAQVLVAGVSMLPFNAIAAKLVGLIQASQPESHTACLSALPIPLGLLTAAKFGVDVESSGWGPGFLTIFPRIMGEIGQSNGYGPSLSAAMGAALVGFAGLQIIERQPQPRNFITTALAISALIATDMLMNGSGLLRAGLCAASAALPLFTRDFINTRSEVLMSIAW
jgi:hypothetical protein